MADDKTKRGSPDRRTARRTAAPKKKAGARSGSARVAAAPAARRKAASKPGVRAAPHPPRAEKTTENTAPRTMKTADAVDLLTDDHLQVSALFKQYEKLTKKNAPADQRRALAATMCGMLTAHTTIEEEIFYPAARKESLFSGRKP